MSTIDQDYRIYQEEKELMKITTNETAFKMIEEIGKEYPVFKELEKKLTYEQGANLYFLVEHLYWYQEMWKSLKSAKINDKGIQHAIKILIKDIEQEYFKKEEK